MKKFFVFLLVGSIFVFQGCTMAASNLIDEISALDKPEIFKSRPILENAAAAKIESQNRIFLVMAEMK